MASQPNLFVQTAFLGDLCLSVPTLKHLKKLYPQSEIWLVARSGFGSLLKELKIVDRVFEVKKGSRSSYQAIKNELIKTQFNLVVSPHESLTSARLISGLRAQKKIGYKKLWNFPFFSDRVAKNRLYPEALRQLSLLSVCDVELKNKLDSIHPEDHPEEWITGSDVLKKPPLWASGQVPFVPEIDWPQKNSAQPYICVFPGSVWQTKRWTTSGFIEVAKFYAAQGYQIFLLGSGQEKLICDEIETALNLPSVVVSCAGQFSLLEILSVLKNAQLVISNDSGGSHLASLTNTPTLSIFGPTVISQGFRPWVEKSSTVSIEGLKCRPCGAHGHHKCPLGTHECMKGLSANQVIEKAKILLVS